MCNLYSMTTSQQAIREIAGAMNDRAGNLRHSPRSFPTMPPRSSATGHRDAS